MIACQIAYTLFHTPTKIARIRAAEYIQADKAVRAERAAVSTSDQPGAAGLRLYRTTHPVSRALSGSGFRGGQRSAGRRPGATDGQLVGQQLRTLKEHIPNTRGRVAAIYRDGKSIELDGDTVVREGDEVFFIAARKDIRVFMSEMRKTRRPGAPRCHRRRRQYRLPAGAALEQTNQVKIIERDPVRARQISETTRKTIVLVGDAADEELLLEENIDNADVFCA